MNLSSSPLRIQMIIFPAAVVWFARSEQTWENGIPTTVFRAFNKNAMELDYAHVNLVQGRGIAEDKTLQKVI